MTFLKIKFSHQSFLAGTPIVIYPLLVVGGVRLDEAQTSCLLSCSFKVQADIYSAGIWANLFYSTFPLMVAGLWFGNLKLLLIGAASACVLGFGKKLFYVYLLPAFSVVAGAYLLPRLLVYLFKNLHPNATFASSIGGSLHYGISWARGIDLCLSLGVALALLNLLPILPMDGGRLVYALIGSKSKFLARVFMYASLLLFFGILFNAFLSEGYAVLKMCNVFR